MCNRVECKVKYFFFSIQRVSEMGVEKNQIWIEIEKFNLNKINYMKKPNKIKIKNCV